MKEILNFLLSIHTSLTLDTQGQMNSRPKTVLSQLILTIAIIYLILLTYMRVFLLWFVRVGDPTAQLTNVYNISPES